MNFGFEGEDAGWTFERGWHENPSGEEFYFWEPIPLSVARFLLGPTSDRAVGMMGVQAGIWTALNAFTTTLSGQSYRSLSGLVFEAIFGVSPGPVAVATSPLIGAAGTAYLWDKIGDPKTGATHYAGSGTMSGGSMPVVPSDNRWWHSWELPW